jgi:chemotaxis methyl-accepting protein methylase
MQERKQINFENIEIQQPESGYQIRQDRKSFPLGEVFIEINGNIYPIENISTFGIAIRINEDIIFNTNDLLASIMIKNKEIQKIHLKPVRQFFKDGHQYIAFENIDNYFDIENIKIVHKVNHIIERYKNIVKPKKINEDFKNLTINLYYWLRKVEEDINSFNIENFYFSKKEIENFENKIINAVSEHLKNYIMDVLNQLENTISNLSDKEKKYHYNYFREICGDFFDQSYLGYRAYHKPRGYAGDYEMLRLIYENQPRGTTLFAKCMDKFFLSALESEAVRNRAKYLEKKIKNFVKINNKAKIVSFGCGIAKEIQNLLLSDYKVLKDVEIHFIDQDIEALKNAQKDITNIIKQKNLELNVNYHNWGIKNILKDGFIWGKSDLVYSAGVYDYLTDKMCYKLTSVFYDLLNPGGQIIIGNFNTNTPEHLVRTIILDWILILRDKSHLKNLFSPINKVIIEKEPLNINLFAIIKK